MSTSNDKLNDNDEIIVVDETGKERVLRSGEILEAEKEEKNISKISQKEVIKPWRPAFNFTPLESPAIHGGVKYPEFTQGLKPPANFLTEFIQLVDKIILKTGLSFKDGVLASRFKSIILSRLKDIRSPQDLLEKILESTVTGGLGLNSEETERILKIIEQEVADFNNEKLGLKPREFKKSTLSDLPELTFKKSTAEEVFAGESPAPLTFIPKTLGPIDEIKEITLVDFRQFSPRSQEAAKKVLEKIQLLEMDSFKDKILGLKAWRESQVYRFYVELGRQSMEQKISIAEVIKQRLAAGQPTLTEEEFMAISDLNQRLRF